METADPPKICFFSLPNPPLNTRNTPMAAPIEEGENAAPIEEGENWEMEKAKHGRVNGNGRRGGGCKPDRCTGGR